MRSVVISLRRSRERRAMMIERLDAIGIDYEFFDAVDAAAGDHLTVSRYDEALCLKHFGAPLTASEIGCYASHYAVWRLCVERDEPVAVLEDDIVFTALFSDVLALAAELVDEHRFIRLAGKHSRKFRILKPVDERHDLVRFLKGPIGTQGYALSPAGASALLDRATRWIEPVDHYIDSFWKHGLASKAILPFELREMDRDTIGGTIGSRDHRRTGLAKLRRELDRQKQACLRAIYNAAKWPN